MVKQKIKMLSPTDIYDFYGCSYVFSMGIGTPTDTALCVDRIDEVYNLYVTACKERIKAEARYLGVEDGDLETMTIAKMTEMVAELVIQEMHSDEANEILMRGGGFNFAKIAIQAQRASGMDMGDIDLAAFGVASDETPAIPPPGIDVNWFDGAEKSGGRVIKDPKWHKIAEAYVRLEEACTTDDKIQAIDALNALQHNSFHILIDLQTGRMLEGDACNEVDYNEARGTLQEVLDIKYNSRTPMSYIGKMSSDIRNIVKSCKGMMP